MPHSAPLLLPATILLLSILCIPTHSAYIPELSVCASTKFINHELIKYGPMIEKQLDTVNITLPPFNDKFEGVHVEFNLTDIKQKFQINWRDNASIINVKDQHTFELLMKNINITMNGHIEFKVGATAKQKGTLDIFVQKLQIDLTLAFSQPNCGPGSQGRTLGFNLNIIKAYVNPQKISVKIQHKTIDNIIIRAVISVLKSRLPSIIEKAALSKGNLILNQLTCAPITELLPLGDQSYVVIVNTTEVPHFLNKDQLFVDVDVTFINQVTNATNQESQDDQLPEKNLFPGRAEITLSLSSNMLDSILWLIDDSKVLNIEVTNDMLGPNPPIQLNTLNLSILIPSLMKWPRKEVVLMIQPSNRFAHLYIRDGKIIAALSLSIKFVVNISGTGAPLKQCLQTHNCIVACDLNATIPLSVAAHISNSNTLQGLLHTVSIEQLKTITTEIEVRTEQLKRILNTMIGSARPQINQQLQTGIAVDVSKLEKYEVEEVLMMIKKDFMGVGIVFKK